MNKIIVLLTLLVTLSSCGKRHIDWERRESQNLNQFNENYNLSVTKLKRSVYSQIDSYTKNTITLTVNYFEGDDYRLKIILDRNQMIFYSAYSFNYLGRIKCINNNSDNINNSENNLWGCQKLKLIRDKKNSQGTYWLNGSRYLNRITDLSKLIITSKGILNANSYINDSISNNQITYYKILIKIVLENSVKSKVVNYITEDIDETNSQKVLIRYCNKEPKFRKYSIVKSILQIKIPKVINGESVIFPTEASYHCKENHPTDLYQQRLYSRSSDRSIHYFKIEFSE